MLHGMKIRLLPTPEQELQFRKSVGVARWVYNYTLTRFRDTYVEYKCGLRSKPLTEGTIRKELTQLKKTDFPWLAEVGSNVVKQAAKDCGLAMSRYLKGLSSKPKYKSRSKSNPSFYVNYESFTRVGGGFRGEKLGFVRTKHPLPKLPKGVMYSNPRISFDGKYWYISFAIPVERPQVALTDNVLGIDLGLKTLAVTSDGDFFPNINKSKQVRNLEKRLRRKQRHLARQLLANTKEYKVVNGYKVPVYIRPLHECKNITKTKQEIKLLYRKLSNLRLNHIHQLTSTLVKRLPKAIVLEDLNIKGLMKNKHLAKHIQKAMWYEVRRQLEYKCSLYSIDLILVDRFYPSSKLCSSCFSKKTDLKLSDRVYKCTNCGLKIDRDYNAALNLATYVTLQ